MKDKLNLSESRILILLIFIGFVVIYGVYRAQLQSVPSRVATNQDELYGQTAMPTMFAPTQNPPTVTLNWVDARPNVLRLNLMISGLELVANADDLENYVCNPYIRADEPVSLMLKYREAEIPEQVGEPIAITYEYDMDAAEHKVLTFILDLTIGPCADHLNFQETNVTPSSPIPDLIANYRLNFKVSVQ